jgi:hypothetical protein
MAEIHGKNFIFAFELEPLGSYDLYDIYHWFEPGTIKSSLGSRYRRRRGSRRLRRISRG